MKLTKCSNDHFYDADKYTSCPHCGGGSGDAAGVTIAGPTGATNLGPTVGAPMGSMPTNHTPLGVVNDDPKTIAMWKKDADLTVEPTVGWLVCVKGPDRGNDYKIKPGKNFIGRSKSMSICIAGDDSISRDKHAVVIFDPMGSRFLVQAGESTELTYLNNQLVVSISDLKKHDRIKMGASELMFIPCCDEHFSWNELDKAEKE